ncbi:MAG: phosphoglycerate dehydrogenase [Ignavibacteriae bacterium]|nr:phosphoglycerate dehydrogenase [Ignavibacteriota bacterium]
MNILITDPVDKQCIDILNAEGFSVYYRPGLSYEEFLKVIVDVDALIVRGQTKVTAEVLETGKNLKVVGRAGAGVDNIDVEAATRRGVIVMNTPGGNTISTAEHTMSMMLALARNIPQAFESLRENMWERSKFIGTELYGKTLGIIGLGKVGTEVARRALAFEMKVIAYDPLLSQESGQKIGVEIVQLDDLYERSDVISIHSPLTSETKGMIGQKALSKCKRGVKIINCARGEILDETALLEALEEGRVGGAALDVFTIEPPTGSPLLLHPNVIATPHLGASTEEAQEKVAIQIAHQIADALKERGVVGSVNADIIQLAIRKEIRPYLLLAEKLGRLLAQLMEGKLKTVTVGVTGEFLRESLTLLSSAVLKGIFEKVLFEPVNYINAPVIARERGIAVQLHQEDEHELYSHVLSVKYETDKESRQFDGTVFGNRDIRIISIDGFILRSSPKVISCSIRTSTARGC